MQLNDIIAHSLDQEKGRWFDLAEPVEGKPSGIRLRIAGPDSETQHKSRLAFADELVEMADENGRVSAEIRERLRIKSLARCVLDWEIEEDGAPVPFGHANVVRLLKAGQWVQQQIDAFAGERPPMVGAD